MVALSSNGGAHKGENAEDHTVSVSPRVDTLGQSDPIFALFCKEAISAFFSGIMGEREEDTKAAAAIGVTLGCYTIPVLGDDALELMRAAERGEVKLEEVEGSVSRVEAASPDKWEQVVIFTEPEMHVCVATPDEVNNIGTGGTLPHRELVLRYTTSDN